MSDESTKLDEENIQNYKWDPEVENKSYELYPQRSKDYKEPGFFASLMYKNQKLARLRCEQYVAEAFEKNPRVKLLAAALKSVGCEVDLKRHVCCEFCHSWVTGGYDNRYNQIVICQNNTTKAMVSGVIGHELLHVYDWCRAKLDWDNLEHIACTEIRAANLFHCSILSGIWASSVNIFNLKKAHADCVKQKAVASVLAVRPSLSKAEAWSITERVFDKCYNDLEPIGRRPRVGSNDQYRAYRERFLYGYF